jgi:hypothetical protein
MIPHAKKGLSRIPLPIALLCVALLVGLLVASTVWVLMGGGGHEHLNIISSHTATATPNNAQISPLLFGTNLSLYNGNDQVLTSTTTRTLLQQIHTHIVRMPIRDEVPEAVNIQAAQAIKGLGATPLIILHGATFQNPLADDMLVVRDMNRIFGEDIVYYEFGNENDLQGVAVDRYTATWNATVPQLKRLAIHAHFVGPVNFHYDHYYLSTFLQNANPRPDEISWHEYSCADAQAPDVCIAHVAHWTDNVQDARALMTSTIGAALPIMITEWNYAPDAVPNDGKNNNSAFMRTWTTTALQTLGANRVFASMQYSCTHPIMPLITTDDTLTVQGSTFAGQYQRMILEKQVPAALSTTVATVSSHTTSSGVTANGPIMISFEDGATDGWSGHGIAAMQSSTIVAQDGTHSLHVALRNGSSADFPYISLDLLGLASYPKPGQTITAYVYSQSNAVTLGARLFVVNNDYQWHSDTMVTLAPGTWNRLTYSIPSSVTQPRQIGIQFNCTSGVGTPSDVYIDAIGWK